MQAILEMILAVVAAICELFVTIAVAISELCMLIFEFTVTALTRGIGEAKTEYSERRQIHAAKHAEGTAAQKSQAMNAWWALSIAALIVGFIAWGFVNARIQQQKEDQTQQQITQKAAELIRQVKQDPALAPKAGMLAEQDAWGRPLELFVDQFPVGTLLVVRSAGRDGKPGTLDDLLAVQESHPGAIDLGKGLVKQGVEELKKRWKPRRK